MYSTEVPSCDMSPIMLVINTDLLVLCIDWYGKRPHPFFKLEHKHTTIKLQPPLHMQNTRPCHQLLSQLCISLGEYIFKYKSGLVIIWIQLHGEGSAVFVVTSQSWRARALLSNGYHLL